MTDSGIKSKPVYAALSAIPAARRHILVGEGNGADTLLRLRSSLVHDTGTPDTRHIAIFYTVGAGPDRTGALVGTGGQAVKTVPDREQLCETIRTNLAGAPMGTRLYVAGTEPFLWAIALTAREAGMPDAAIQMERCGPAIRAVRCVHCRTTAPAVERTIYQCPGCGLHLMVRDHFSRRLGVYQGVCVDAEAPGEIPEAEELEP